MFDPKSLVRVEKANSRTTTTAADLIYSTKTGKFRVSNAFFEKHDMENFGLTAYEDVKGNRLIVVKELNETAVMFKGREGSNKTREFTSSRLRALMNRYGLKGHNEFNFEQIHEDTDTKSVYFTLAAQDEVNEKEAADTTEDAGFVPTEQGNEEAAAPGPIPATETSEPEPEETQTALDDDIFSDEEDESVKAEEEAPEDFDNDLDNLLGS